MVTINPGEIYRKFLVIFAVGMFFTNFADYSQRWGLIPLFWIALLIGLSFPLVLSGLYRGHLTVPPLLWWALFYLGLSVIWFYRTEQDAVAYQEVQTRILAVVFLFLGLMIVSRESDQKLARQAVAVAVLIATALNVYEFFNPMTFSTIPGRSSGIYTNVNQSGAALVLGLILAYQVIPDRFKMLFVAITAAGIFPTFSRSAMIGWLIVVTYLWLRSGLITQLRRLIIFSLSGVILTWSPIWKNLEQTIENRGVLNLNVLERISFFTAGTRTDDSANERKAVAHRAWDLFGQQPILGWGTGASRHIEGFDVGTHNIYLAMMVDHGLLGLFVIPILILAVLWGANRRTMDVTIPFTSFILIWGMFSHNVLEERFILFSVALVAAMVASNRTAPAVERTVIPAVLTPAREMA